MSWRETGKTFSFNDSSGLLSGGGNSSNALDRFYELEPAIVTDVFNDDPGKIKLVTFFSKRELIAYPLNQNIKIVPLLGEIVIFSEYRLSMSAFEQGRSFYESASWFNSPHANDIPETLDVILNEWKKPTTLAQFFSARKIAGVPSKIKKKDIGAYFKKNVDTHSKKLLTFEGDILFEGRVGQSIRFGSSIPKKVSFGDKKYSGLLKESTIDKSSGWMFSKNQTDGSSPLIILSSGKKLTNADGLSLENIQDDPATILMCEGGPIGIEFPFLLSAISAKPASKTIPDKFNDSMILLNSERLIFNSYKEDIIISSKKEVLILSEGNVNLNSKKGKFKIDVPGNISLSGKTVSLGAGAETGGSPIAKYDPLFVLLKRLVNAIVELKYTPNGIPIPSTQISLLQIKQELDNAGTIPLFGSSTVFTV